MYYIKTRPGDVYDPAALERDLKELLSLNFFDKTATRVLTEDGVRGGVNVIFEVRELPIIRDLQFEGAKAVQESDILKEFREKRVGIAKESVYDPVKARDATRILREMLASKGFPNAKVDVTGRRGLGYVDRRHVQYRSGIPLADRRYPVRRATSISRTASFATR